MGQHRWDDRPGVRPDTRPDVRRWTARSCRRPAIDRRARSPIATLAAVFGAILAVVLVAGCAGLPTSGSPQVVRKVADQSIPAAPQGPDPGQQPEQIVREFIHASALTEYDTAGESFVVAREYLTPAAQKSWHADSSSTPIVVLSDDFSATPDPDNPGTVTVSGRQVGAVESDRSYRPVDSRDYQITVHLDKTDGQWRITDPPDSVLITRGDFSTALRSRTVYFLDATGRVVVPDIRYIPNSHNPELSANRLMDLLLRGPSKQLTGAARTQLGPGAELQSNVHIDSAGIAHVDLGGVDVTTPAARQALAAQVVWTLDPDVQQIAITVNGLPLNTAGAAGGSTTGPTASASNPDNPDNVYSLASGTVENFSPDAVPGSAQAVSDAYYIDSGVILRLSDGTPMWGSVGTGSVHVLSAALSAASGALAAVTRNPDGGQELLVGRPFDHQPAVTALKATTLTQPSFTRWGFAAWTVQNGATQPEVYQVTITSGAPTWSRVPVPGLAGLGPVTALTLSPDGVRVAVVAGGALYLGVISPTTDTPEDPSSASSSAPASGASGGPTGTSGSATGTAGASGGGGAAGGSSGTGGASGSGGAANADHHGMQITGLTVLRPYLTDVGPVTWEDSTTLLVGAKITGSTHRTVFEVSVDGQSEDAVTTSQVFGDVFGDVEAIASSNSDLPLLISFGGRIWQLQGGRLTGQWVPPDGRNWMTGTMPFYPN